MKCTWRLNETSTSFLKMRGQHFKNSLINRFLEFHHLQTKKIQVNLCGLRNEVKWIITSFRTSSGFAHFQSSNSGFSLPSPKRLISLSSPVNLKKNLEGFKQNYPNVFNVCLKVPFLSLAIPSCTPELCKPLLYIQRKVVSEPLWDLRKRVTISDKTENNWRLTSPITFAETIPVSSFNSLNTAAAGSSFSSTPPFYEFNTVTSKLSRLHLHGTCGICHAPAGSILDAIKTRFSLFKRHTPTLRR